jgi:hypothetical protein
MRNHIGLPSKLVYDGPAEPALIWINVRAIFCGSLASADCKKDSGRTAASRQSGMA